MHAVCYDIIQYIVSPDADLFNSFIKNLHFPAISLPGTAKHPVFPSVPVHSCPFNNMHKPHVRSFFYPHYPQLSTNISPKVIPTSFSFYFRCFLLMHRLIHIIHKFISPRFYQFSFHFRSCFFCTHLINLHVFYIFSAFPLDIYKPAILVIQYSAYESQKQFL